MEDQHESPLRFPCEFPIKAMGPSAAPVQERVMEIVHAHAPEVTEQDVTRRHSRNGRYVSITVTVNAVSQKQLDMIYRDLNNCEAIIMTL